MTRCTPSPGERVEVGGQGGDEGLALTGLHLGDPAEVQRGAAHDLDVEVALAERARAGLADRRERLGQEVVEVLLLLVVGRRSRSSCSRQVAVSARSSSSERRLHLGLERADLGRDRLERP